MIRVAMPLAALASAWALVAAPAMAQAQTAASGAAAAAVPDPARLAIARELAAKLIPAGMYERMMGGNFTRMMDSVIGSTGSIPLRDFAQITGLEESEAAELGTTTLREVMEVYDPHWEERQQKMIHAMTGEMGKLLSTLEPKVRDALGRAYAREYDLAELQELQRFFGTPAGAHYARSATELMSSPEMTETMAEAMPEVMKQMPALIASAQQAAGDLPPPRKDADLTPEERKKVADLLGRQSAPDAK